MSEGDSYTLRFIGTSPEELPAPVLLELFQLFLNVTENPNEIRFVGVSESSYGADISPTRSYEIAFQREMLQAENDNLPPSRLAAKKAFSERVAARSLSAELRSPSDDVLVSFGRPISEERLIDLSAEGFFEPFTIDVKVMKLQTVNPGSRKTTIGLLPLDERRQLPNATVDHELGEELSRYYRKDVTATGTAKWARGEQGNWRIVGFELESFKPKAAEVSPWAIFRKMDELADSWPKETAERLAEIRGARE